MLQFKYINRIIKYEISTILIKKPQKKNYLSTSGDRLDHLQVATLTFKTKYVSLAIKLTMTIAFTYITLL